MNEVQNLQRALQAEHELDITSEAFATLRERYITQTLAAKDPTAAYEAVLSVRVLDSVLSSLRSIIETSKLDKIGKE